jgi:hypothetical protein
MPLRALGNSDHLPEWIEMKNPVEQAFTVAGLAAHLGRGVGRVAADAVVGGRLGLPRTVEDIDAAVLSKVMGTTVRSVRVLGSDAGTSSRARLVLTGKDAPDSGGAIRTCRPADRCRNGGNAGQRNRHGRPTAWCRGT